MKLVLAEKPSVAQSLAKVLGANKHCDGYLEGNGYIVSWCVGHLVELAAPEVYDEKYGKWRLEDLPILPDDWIYQVSSSTRKQYGILKDLMKRADVESLVCATDAGREGELIFRLVYHQAGCRKPFERLWISSMEDQAIKDGFAHLEPSTKYDALYEAALCRERADWIVGMNATRLFSCLYHQTLNIGRVMTPTLAMVVMRDAEIAAFQPKPFYTVQLGMNGITAASRRFDEKGDAQQLLATCKETMKAVIKSMERKEKTERAPLLYDLTSLQRDANRILGFTAQQTLDYTQALYEKKLVTYPRTDSRYLTDDMKPMLPALISQVAEKIGVDASALKSDDKPEISVDVMCDSRKVSDHHAIIPTKTMCSANLTELPSGEKAILQLIAVRLLCAAAPDHRYAEDTIVLTCGGEEFSKKIKTVLFGGWKDIWQRFYPVKDKEKEAYTGPTLLPDTIVSLSQAEIKEGKTTAPKRFTEDIHLDFEDWRADLEEQYPDLSEDELIQKMYEINSDYLGDERMNLNVQLSQPILVVADIGRWDGRYDGYAEIKTGNIKDCLYSEMDMCEWYVDKYGDLRADAVHHDGTNHYLYRVYKDTATDSQIENLKAKIYDGKATRADITRVTRRLGDEIAAVYGFDIPRQKKNIERAR